jgi:hypothetical protein
VVAPFAGYRFINVCDCYLAQRVVILKEPPQKVFNVPTPGPNGRFREPLFRPQVVSIRFEPRTISRRRLAGNLQAPQETKPADRTREEFFAAASTIFVLMVPGPTIDPSVHARLDGGRTEGVRGRRQTEQILDQQQVCCQPSKSNEAVTLVSTILQILQPRLQERAVEMVLHRRLGSKKLVEHLLPPKSGIE